MQTVTLAELLFHTQLMHLGSCFTAKGVLQCQPTMSNPDKRIAKLVELRFQKFISCMHKADNSVASRQIISQCSLWLHPGTEGEEYFLVSAVLLINKNCVWRKLVASLDM